MEYLAAGPAIQTGAANLFDPGVTMKVIDGIEAWRRTTASKTFPG